MKKNPYFLVILLLAAHSLTLPAQTDTLGICDRAKDYVYSNPWMDTYNGDCDGDCFMTAVVWDTRAFTPAIVAKRYTTDTALRIIGVAAPVVISSTGIGLDHIPTLDTSMANRVPEYFYLYNLTDSGTIFMARARWDSLPPRYKMQVRAIPQYTQAYLAPFADTTTYYVTVREAYFAKPITINDSFYVAGSTFNNYMSSYPNTYAHPRTYYIRWQTRSGSDCDAFGYCGADYNDLVSYYCDENSPYQMDSSWRFNELIWRAFGCIFPIFDTSTSSPDTTTVVTHDTCHAPTNLRLLNIEETNATLTWNDNNNYLWEINIVKEGQPADSGTTKTVFSNHTTFSGLDTAQWYIAQVRAICDSTNKSQWSDSCRFFVPNYDTTVTEIATSLLEQYTFVMPNPATTRVTVFSSFHISAIEIFSSEGRRLEEHEIKGLSATIDIDHLASGTYILRITTNSGTVSKRIVKH